MVQQVSRINNPSQLNSSAAGIDTLLEVLCPDAVHDSSPLVHIYLNVSLEPVNNVVASCHVVAIP